jgi:hypothetical protein
MRANYDLVENDDGTFTLTLYSFDVSGMPVIYGTMTASAEDTVYNLLNNVVEFSGSDTGLETENHPGVRGGLDLRNLASSYSSR